MNFILFFLKYWKQIAIFIALTAIMIYIILLNQEISSKKSEISELKQKNNEIQLFYNNCLKINEKNNKECEKCSETNEQCFQQLDNCNKNCEQKIKIEINNIIKKYDVTISHCEQKLQECLTNTQCPELPKNYEEYCNNKILDYKEAFEKLNEHWRNLK